jgi:phage-related protein
MGENEKEVVWLHGRVRTPPFSIAARKKAGELIRDLQDGILLSLPQSRPMPEIGPRCHELRIADQGHAWRIIYRIDPGHVVITAVFSKKTPETPDLVKASCRARLRQYDIEMRG